MFTPSQSREADHHPDIRYNSPLSPTSSVSS